MADRFMDRNKSSAVEVEQNEASIGARRDDSTDLIGALKTSPTLLKMLTMGRGGAIVKDEYKHFVRELNHKAWLNYVPVEEKFRQTLATNYLKACGYESVPYSYAMTLHKPKDCPIENYMAQRTADFLFDVHPDEARRTATNHNVFSLMDNVNLMFETLCGMSDEDIKPLTLESVAKDYFLINSYIASAARNMLYDRNGLVNIECEIIEEKEGEEQKLESQRLMLGENNAVLIYARGDVCKLSTPDADGYFESCDMQISDSGKLVNPTNYKESQYSHGISKGDLANGLVEMVLNTKWEDWTIDHANKKYTATYSDNAGKHSVQFELMHDKIIELNNPTNQHGIECEKLKKLTQTSECEGVKKIFEMNLSALSSEKYYEDFKRVQGFIDEAQNLHEA